MMTNGDYITMDRIRRRHTGHWFDPGSMRFFKSRLSHEGRIWLREGEPVRVLFVSSEKGPGGRRLYSVRVMDWTTGDVDTVGDFQAHTSSRQAWTHVERLLGDGAWHCSGGAA